MKKMKITIVTKSGEGGRLFGSITSKDIAEALKEQQGITVDKRKIVLEQPIKEIGTTRVKVKIYPEITGVLTVEVKD